MEEIQIINDKPPIWDSVCQAFGVIPQSAVFTYGNRIYNPDGADLPDHIIEHEKVHIKQQTTDGMTPELWWGKFLREPEFRVEQEAQAYGRQYAFIVRRIKDRNQKFKVLQDLARILSGPLYNNSISQMAAAEKIRGYSGIKR